MKTIFDIKISVGLIALLALGNCDKDAGTFPIHESSAIIKVEGPATVRAGEELLVKVTLQGNNGCAFSGDLREIVNGNIRTITGKVNYKGEVCTQVLVSIVANYSFKASTPGTYELKFLKADKTFLSHNVKVD